MTNDYCEAVKQSMAEIPGDVTSWITASANFQAVHDVLSFPPLTSSRRQRHPRGFYKQH